MSRPIVAVINDDPGFLELIQDLIRDARKYQVETIQQGMGAATRLRVLQPDIVIIDIRLEYERLGYHILEVMRRDDNLRDTPAIVCTADTKFLDKNAAQLVELGAEILAKPFDLDDLLAMIDAALEEARPAM